MKNLRSRIIGEWGANSRVVWWRQENTLRAVPPAQSVSLGRGADVKLVQVGS